MTSSRIRWVVLAAVYAVFLVWYGGSSPPMSISEIEKYMAIVEVPDSAPGGDSEVSLNLRQFMETDDGKEFIMVNLNVYRDAPQPAAGLKGIGSAEEAEVESQLRMARHLFARACHPLTWVEPSVLVKSIGEFERQDWSRVALVRYRSRRDFVEVILNPALGRDVDREWAALSRSMSMAATPGVSFATIRVVPLLILIAVGLLLDRRK